MTYENRIFLSADLTGSTKFKYNVDAGAQEFVNKWEEVIVEFYSHFCKEFPRQIGVRDVRLSKNLEPWKVLGDEIIFSSKLDRFDDALTILDVFRDVLIGYRDRLSSTPDLGVKGAAWMIDIPVRNKKISAFSWLMPVADEAERARDFDYIGQSMDAGFRLAAQSNPYRMAVSLELALIAAEAERRKGLRDLPWGYGGRVELKGVLGERFASYPFVFLDTESKHVRPPFDLEEQGLHDAEERLNVRRQVTPADIIDLAKSFIKKHKAVLYMPYFEGCDVFGEKPEKYTEWEFRQKEKIIEENKEDESFARAEQAPENPEDNGEIDEFFSDIFGSNK